MTKSWNNYAFHSNSLRAAVLMSASLMAVNCIFNAVKNAIKFYIYRMLSKPRSPRMGAVRIIGHVN